MGSQNPTSCDSTKTYWTPTMERFFIDLMLDHMHKGNRVGHTFNKQAWTDMLTVFNAKFGCQYDKDGLKNCYTTLWKQFNDLKNLLDQSGFFWDDTRQMVVADEYVWDAFTKAQPDAQYYRNKTVMNFSDLCLIYAYTTADGRYSRSSHDVDFDDEIQGVNIGEGKEGRTPTVSNCLRIHWTPPMDSYLVDLLLDQVQRGNRIGHAFITQAWNEMMALFNAKFGSHFDKEVFNNRYIDLRHKYNDINALLDQTGFYWDETHEMVIAEDYIWDSYAKAYPDAQLYKYKTMPGYHKLCVIYGEEGSNARPSPVAHNVDYDSDDPVLMIDSDCSREDWTPSMDRYLIDLMLEQVHKGHKTNYVFNKQAWLTIVAAFSDRFGSQHDKYVLEGRHKCLRKLYDDMKNLLDHSEFSWDETQQTVTASDGVWDVYIKEHPDVKSFRTKTQLNYNDLCVIYGNSTLDGGRNASDQHVNFCGDGWASRALKNGGYHRNGWTPLMDRYLLDLMLEQIRRGNMVEQKFSKQAWCDMVIKFNSTFGFQRHKDDLEACFKYLRKKFNDMKTLLDRSGFAWNEMQQMITADDDLWDAYITENPDANSYRSRTLPNYNDLFLIYGNSITNGVHNQSNHCICLDDEILGLNFDQHDDESSDGSDILGIDWTKPMDQFFIDLMLEQVFEGNKIGHTFTKQAWVYIMRSFNENFGLHCDNYVMENRYIGLMKQYNDISNILNQSGFTWDDFQQTITADDDAWDAYVKDHPDAVIFRDKILESYSGLSIIFGNGIQDGRSSYLDPEMDNDCNTLEMGMDEILGDPKSPGRDIKISGLRKKRRSTAPLTSASSRKVQKRRKERLQNADRSNAQGKNYSSIESIVNALQALPDMDDELFLHACDLLEDEKKAEAFVKMDIAQRKKWLLRKLRL